MVEAQPAAAAREYVERWLRAGRAGERGHSEFPFGQYSDDTQLARELLRSVRDAGGWNPAAFAANLAELFRVGRDVGAGPGTRAAAGRLLGGAHWSTVGTPAPYAGNGSAMRAGPIGVLCAGDEATLRQVAREQSRITHQDPRCAAGAIAVAHAVALARGPQANDPSAFLAQVVAAVEPEDGSVAEALRGLADWLRLNPEPAAHHLYRLRLDPSVGAPEQGISSSVTPSVAWSLYAFLRSPDDHWETLCTAIAVGGDTDTMAAMAGAISGARLGVAALPGGLLERLTDRGEWGAGELARLARDCARLVPIRVVP